MKSFFLSFVLVIAVSCINGVYAQTNLDTKAFVKKYKETPKAQLLDVRTPNEWNAGKIESSTCANFMEADFKQQVEKMDKSKPVFVYCAAGGRSTKASKILKEAGFKEVYNLQGAGYADLAKEGIK